MNKLQWNSNRNCNIFIQENVFESVVCEMVAILSRPQCIYFTAENPQYGDVKMNTMASQITSLTIVYSTVHSGADERSHQRFASLAFVRGIHRWTVNSPHKGPVTRKMFPFDDVIILLLQIRPSHSYRVIPILSVGLDGFPSVCTILG